MSENIAEDADEKRPWETEWQDDWATDYPTKIGMKSYSIEGESLNSVDDNISKKVL